MKFFVTILKFSFFFLVPILIGEEKCGFDVAGGCFTDVVLHSSGNRHQEHAAEPSWLSKNIAAAWGAVTSRFHKVSNLHK